MQKKHWAGKIFLSPEIAACSVCMVQYVYGVVHLYGPRLSPRFYLLPIRAVSVGNL
jgi:hypothetical protein